MQAKKGRQQMPGVYLQGVSSWRLPDTNTPTEHSGTKIREIKKEVLISQWK